MHNKSDIVIGQKYLGEFDCYSRFVHVFTDFVPIQLSNSFRWSPEQLIEYL